MKLSWIANKRIAALEAELASVKGELATATESLAAERAVTADYDRCLDEALTVIAESGPTIDLQRQMINSLKATLGEYQHILDSQVAPLCKEVIALCGGRDAQRAFVLDD